MDSFLELNIIFLVMFFSVFLVGFSSNVLAQSELDNLQIIEGTGFFYGFGDNVETKNITIGNSTNASFLGNFDEPGWYFDYLLHNSDVALDFGKSNNNALIIAKTTDNLHTLVYRNLSEDDKIENVSWFNMKNYILDVGTITNYVDVLIKDVNGECYFDDDIIVKSISDGSGDLNYVNIDLIDCFDGELNITIGNNDPIKVNKSSLFNISTDSVINNYNLTQPGNYYHVVKLLDDASGSDLSEAMFFYNDSDRYYELGNSTDKLYKAFSVSGDEYVTFNSQEKLNKSIIYRYINLSSGMIRGEYIRGTSDCETSLSDGGTLIISNFSLNGGNNFWTLGDFNFHSEFPFSSWIDANPIHENETSLKVIKHLEDYELLFLGVDSVGEASFSSFDHEILLNSTLSIQLDSNGKLIDNYIYFPRFTLELGPGNYTIMVNDSKIYEISETKNEYEPYNLSLFKNNTLIEYVKHEDIEKPGFYYFIFELETLSNITLVDSQRETIDDHDIILSKYTQWKDFDKNIPIDIGINGDNFFYSVCNSSNRSLDSTICDYYMHDNLEENKQFSFDDPYIFIDYNITKLFGFNRYDFTDENRGFNFRFVLSGSDYVDSMIIYNESDIFYKDSRSNNNIDMNWTKYDTPIGSGIDDCYAGFFVQTGNNYEYVSQPTGHYQDFLGDQSTHISKGDLTYYHNYLLFRKCYKGEWVPLIPALDFTEQNTIFVNEKDQCGVDESSIDYYYDKDYEIKSIGKTFISYVIENASFESYHQCHEGTWISSHYQNFNALISIANDSHWEEFSIYCDWTANLDMADLNGESFPYEQFPQGCVLKNLEDDDTVISLVIADKGITESTVESIIKKESKYNLDFKYNTNDEYIQTQYNVIFNNNSQKDFLIIYNTSLYSDSEDIKSKFSSINEETSGIFTRIKEFFSRLLKFITNTDTLDFKLNPKDYYAISYTQDSNEGKAIHSFAYLNERDSNGYPKTYNFELEFNNFEEVQINMINRSLGTYHLMNDNLSVLISNISDDNKTVTFYKKGITLDNYRKFYNDLIPNLRVE